MFSSFKKRCPKISTTTALTSYRRIGYRSIIFEFIQIFTEPTCNVETLQVHLVFPFLTLHFTMQMRKQHNLLISKCPLTLHVGIYLPCLNSIHRIPPADSRSQARVVSCSFFHSFFFFFLATPVLYGSSQANPHHNCSNARSLTHYTTAGIS